MRAEAAGLLTALGQMLLQLALAIGPFAAQLAHRQPEILGHIMDLVAQLDPRKGLLGLLRRQIGGALLQNSRREGFTSRIHAVRRAA